MEKMKEQNVEVPSASSTREEKEEEQSPVCALCHDPAEDPIPSQGCEHIFCRMCVTEFLDAAQPGVTTLCPSCDKPLTVNLNQDYGPGRECLPTKRSAKRPRGSQASFLSRLDLKNFQSSTKIEALREEIYDMLALDPGAKAIVFSQFTSMLDLCWFRLEQTGIKCIKLSGNMSLKAREAAITRFSNGPDVTVFLMSLKAGGVALNLTAASYCFVLDSWWNPATEWQAMDRIHRLGQFKPMKCIKFVISGTIEERIVKLQEKKKLIFEATVGGDAEAIGRLTEDDFKFLFK